MRKNLRVVYIFICSMGHCFFRGWRDCMLWWSPETCLGHRGCCFDRQTDRSKRGSGGDSTRICGENNLTCVATRNHHHVEGSGDIGRQNAKYWQVDIKVTLRKEVPKGIRYKLNSAWSNRILSPIPLVKDLFRVYQPLALLRGSATTITCHS
jgi:hypothetical protein